MGSHAVILLDTHIMVWSATDDPRLGKQARSMINQYFRPFPCQRHIGLGNRNAGEKRQD
jgi:hypothetical protein